MANTKLTRIADLHAEMLWLEDKLGKMHEELRRLLDAPTTAEYRLAVSLAPKKEDKAGVEFDEDGSIVRPDSSYITGMFTFHLGPSTQPKPKEDKLRVSVNVKIAVKVLSLLVDEYSARYEVVQKNLNRLVK